MTEPVVFFANALQNFKVALPVIWCLVDGSPAVAAGGDVVERAVKFQAKWSGHSLAPCWFRVEGVTFSKETKGKT
jgi:hypothetical protein